MHLSRFPRVNLCHQPTPLEPLPNLGKGMAGLIGMIRNGRFKKTENVVFLHTGGAAALFAYGELFRAERNEGRADGV